MATLCASSRISISTLSEWLFTKNQWKIGFKQQSDYCRFISLFLSAYGGERVMLVGSTSDDTRFQCDWDGGDYDYLLISETQIPIEALEYRQDVPCFVHIRGESLKDVLPCRLIRGKYIPSGLVKNIEAPAFHQLKGILQLLSRPTYVPGTFLEMDTTINPGKSLTILSKFTCPDLNYQDSSQTNNAGLLDRISAKLENIGDKDGLAVVAMITDMLRQISKVRPCDITGHWSKYQYETIINTLATILNDTKASQDDHTETADLEMVYKPKVDKATSAHQTPDTLLYTTAEAATDKTKYGCDDVLGTYSFKENKDFIGVFPLQGTLSCLVEWKTRERNWPASHVVEEIMHCEIFVVAKPAVSANPDPDIDFCLAFTLAEIKLMKSLTRGQKLCILMIKALLRSSFESYSEILTSFHWKTAVFWVSEREGPHVFNANDPLPALDMVLKYMMSCLEKRDISHYFIRSNLLCGSKFDDVTVASLIICIKEVMRNPIEALMTFYRKEEQMNSLPRTVAIPRKKVDELKKRLLDNQEETLLDTSVECLKSLLTDSRSGSDKSCTRQLQEGINNLLMTVLPELLGDKRHENISGSTTSASAFKGKPAAPSCDINGLIQQGLNYMAMTKDSNREEKNKALEKLRRDGLSLFSSLKK